MQVAAKNASVASNFPVLGKGNARKPETLYGEVISLR